MVNMVQTYFLKMSKIFCLEFFPLQTFCQVAKCHQKRDRLRDSKKQHGYPGHTARWNLASRNSKCHEELDHLSHALQQEGPIREVEEVVVAKYFGTSKPTRLQQVPNEVNCENQCPKGSKSKVVLLTHIRRRELFGLCEQGQGHCSYTKPPSRWDGIGFLNLKDRTHTQHDMLQDFICSLCKLSSLCFFCFCLLCGACGAEEGGF